MEIVINAGMRLFLIFSIGLILTSCGEDDKETQTLKTNLFESNYEKSIEGSLNNSLLGLWLSDSFNKDDTQTQLLWEVTDSSTTLAIQCKKNMSSYPIQIQVTLDFNQDFAKDFGELTPSRLPILPDQSKSFTDFDEICYVALDSNEMAAKSILTSGLEDYRLIDEGFEDGVLELEVLVDNYVEIIENGKKVIVNQPQLQTISLRKIQNR